jgi:hypothetical protein
VTGAPKVGFRIKNRIVAGIVAVLLVLGAAYGLLSWQRYNSIRSICERAAAGDASDRIGALLTYMKSEGTDFEEKNRVIWALGELRDPAVLDELTALHGSETCDHGRFVCQREVRKAINKITGKTPNPYFWQKLDGA